MSGATAAYYPLPAAVSPPFWRRGVFFALVACFHLAALTAVVGITLRQEAFAPPTALTVRMLEETPPPKVVPPKPLPAAPALTHARTPPRPPTPTPQPFLTDAPAAEAAPSFTVVPQAQTLLSETPPAPPPIVAPRFDAAYLQNPKTAYPALSRRYNEEGKVVLRVRVSREGLPLDIEIKQQSGYARLDAAAKSAVEKWRFVPARQGADALESWVLVPITFKLDGVSQDD